MLWAGIPQLQRQDDIIYLRLHLPMLLAIKTLTLLIHLLSFFLLYSIYHNRDALSVQLSEEEAADSFKKLVEISLNTKTTQVLFFMHNLVHPD